MKALIAEDDSLTRKGLAEILRREGYDVFQAENGEIAMALFQAHAPDFVCLDIMMHGTNGFELCRRMRNARPRLPIILISAKSEEIDKVTGLNLGADDFISKPFGVREVVARVRAVTRRCHQLAPSSTTEAFQMGTLKVMPAELRARRGEETIELSLRDIKMLCLLHANCGRALDRNSIFNHCWGEDYLPNSRTLDQHVSQLRKRIEEDPKNPQIIRTVHGVGYRYE